MKLWNCQCGTGKNCGKCPYGTYHYCYICNKIKPNHIANECPESKKKVRFSSKYDYIDSDMEPAFKNGFVLIYNKSSNGNWYVLLQKRNSKQIVAPNGIGVPGGRKEANENDLDAVIRETNEELGYNLEPTLLIKFREGKKCGWYFTKEQLIQSKFNVQKTCFELGQAPDLPIPEGLAVPPFGHFWLNIKDVSKYLNDKPKLIGLDHVILNANKYI